LKVERRRAPRIEKNIPVKIGKEEYEIITETKNLSCIGALCKVDKYIEPLTKLKILLLVPHHDREKKDKYYKIECGGVVVRTEPLSLENGKKAYNIAIYFNEINELDKEKIAKFVEWNLQNKKRSNNNSF